MTTTHHPATPAADAAPATTTSGAPDPAAPCPPPGRAPLADLRRRLTGPVLTAGDDGYTAAATGFNLRSAHRPLAVAAAVDTADVQAAVGFAAAHGIPVGVLSTGHQPFPAQEGFLLITAGAMRTVEIDAARSVARVGAGARWADVVGPAQAAGLAPLNGSAPDVGVIGYTLGGGLSPFLGRTYGWAADHIVRAEVVTPDGRLRHVSADEEPELFAGLRGGRSNFGVVTALEIRLFPVTSFYGGGIYYPAENVRAALDAYAEVTRDAPDALTCSVALLNVPPLPDIPELFRGRLLAHVRVAHLGPDAEAEQLIAPLRTVGPGLLDTIGRHPYSAYPAVHTDPAEPTPYEEKSTLLTCLPREALDRIARSAGPAPDGTVSPVSVVEIRHLGGALSRYPTGTDRFRPAEDAQFSVWGATIGPPQAVDAGIEVLRNLTDGLKPWSTGRAYQNFTAREASATDIFTPAELARLRAVKRRYDPRNLFRVNNHTISPAPAPTT
ncbi:FAD-binding oxidoreductase [Streptomyces sp. NPDC012389]|uniref:FAD-binding oxidoreductase n=1 Tax=Streptomyces sp. NPDC012389 TaxID=3364830 RepID=UPI0036E29F9F